MKATKLFAWACALAVVGVVSAQQPWASYKIRPPQGAEVAGVITETGEWSKEKVADFRNPVPTRIESSYYGERAVLNPLYIECSTFGDQSVVRVVGGEPGAPAFLFCALAPDEIAMPWGVVLVSPDCVTVPGWFDADGVFEMPVNLGQRELCGPTFYLQALEVAPHAMPRLTWGFKLRYAEGNPQPPEVQQTEPATQAILCKVVKEFLPDCYSVLVRFEAAESYVLTVEDAYRVEGKHLVYAHLTRLGGPEPTEPNKWHRATVNVGVWPEPEVEVWVSVHHGEPCLMNKLAAVIKTDF